MNRLDANSLISSSLSFGTPFPFTDICIWGYPYRMRILVKSRQDIIRYNTTKNNYVDMDNLFIMGGFPSVVLRCVYASWWSSRALRNISWGEEGWSFCLYHKAKSVYMLCSVFVCLRLARNGKERTLVWRRFWYPIFFMPYRWCTLCAAFIVPVIHFSRCRSSIVYLRLSFPPNSFYCAFSQALRHIFLNTLIFASFLFWAYCISSSTMFQKAT